MRHLVLLSVTSYLCVRDVCLCGFDLTPSLIGHDLLTVYGNTIQIQYNAEIMCIAYNAVSRQKRITSGFSQLWCSNKRFLYKPDLHLLGQI